MTKARRELATLIPSQDVLIEVLDARLPAASANPILTALRGDTPCVKVLARSDLADPEVTRAWIAHLDAPDVVAFASTSERPADMKKRVADACRRLGLVPAPERRVRALVAGIPNVGKSTLINTLAGRGIAAVSNKPAVTKRQQQILLDSGLLLTDSPGLLWPNIEDEAVALRLALAGSIPDTAIDYVSTARFAAAYLLAHYPALVTARFKLAAAPPDGEALLEAIARKRGGLQRGGAIDLQKASEIFVHDVRAGLLGRLSLESPPPAPAEPPGPAA